MNTLSHTGWEAHCLFLLCFNWALARSREAWKDKRPNRRRQACSTSMPSLQSWCMRPACLKRTQSATVYEALSLKPCWRRLSCLFRQLLVISNIYEGVADTKRKGKRLLHSEPTAEKTAHESYLHHAQHAQQLAASNSEGMEISRSFPLASLSRPQGPRGAREVRRVGRLGTSEYLTQVASNASKDLLA